MNLSAGQDAKRFSLPRFLPRHRGKALETQHSPPATQTEMDSGYNSLLFNGVLHLPTQSISMWGGHLHLLCWNGQPKEGNSHHGDITSNVATRFNHIIKLRCLLSYMLGSFVNQGWLVLNPEVWNKCNWHLTNSAKQGFFDSLHWMAVRMARKCLFEHLTVSGCLFACGANQRTPSQHPRNRWLEVTYLHWKVKNISNISKKRLNADKWHSKCWRT